MYKRHTTYNTRYFLHGFLVRFISISMPVTHCKSENARLIETKRYLPSVSFRRLITSLMRYELKRLRWCAFDVETSVS